MTVFPTDYDAALETIGRLEAENAANVLKIRAADAMAAVIDRWVGSSLISGHSSMADARLDYGDPFSCEEVESRLRDLVTRERAENAELKGANARLQRHVAALEAALRPIILSAAQSMDDPSAHADKQLAAIAEKARNE